MIDNLLEGSDSSVRNESRSWFEADDTVVSRRLPTRHQLVRQNGWIVPLRTSRIEPPTELE